MSDPVKTVAASAIERKLAQLKTTAGKLRRSKFALDAGFLLVCTVLSKAALFLGTAYAAKCLGPFNMGVSGLVLATAQQAGLLYNGGFDYTAVRKIAVNKDQSHLIVQGVISSRFVMALIVALFWMAFCILTRSGENFGVWMLGVPVVLILASGLTFAFQGLETLPVQNVINASGSLITAAIYFLYFRYPMRRGSDLVVYVAVGVLTVIFSHIAYRRITSHWALGFASFRGILPLIRESWRYWLMATLVFYYSIFQVPLVNYLVGTREAGLYRVAYTMADGVWAFFSSITVLLLPRLSVWHSESIVTLWQNQGKLFRIFVAIGLPPILILIFFAERIFRIFLGPAYSDSVLIFKILVFSRFLSFLEQIYAHGLVAAHQDKHVLRIVAAACAFSIVSSLVLVRMFGTVSAAFISVGTEVIILVLSAFMLRRAVVRQTELCAAA